MKRILQLLAALCLLQAGHAAVPDAVSFQGRALTATGEVMGKDGAVNRMFTLRIWDDATSTDAAHLIYSEQQVVSIVDGAFSVLIGTGTATTGTKFSYSETAKGPPTVKIGDAAVFGGASRYVGVTIDDGTTAVDNEILPRQQVVSAPFATRAKLAEGVDAGAITSAQIANNAVTPTQLGDGAVTTSKLDDDAVTTTQLADGSVTSDKIDPGAVTETAIPDGTVTGTDIATGAITSDKLAAGAVTSTTIADGTIASADLADSAVTTAKIADGAITSANISDGSVSPSMLQGMTAIVGMAYIPGGTYTQGDAEISDAAPVTTTVSPFYMDVNLMTWGKWQAVYHWATDNGYSFSYAGQGRFPNHPVHTINWYDAVKWCNARSQQEGLTPVYYTNEAQSTVYKTGNVDVTNAMVKWTANGYRLPTEAEWERAARGGLSGQRFPWGNTISTGLANYSGSGDYHESSYGYSPMANTDTRPYTSPVGSYAPNGYGLYDMAGNLIQMCWDAYDGRDLPGGTDPRGSDFSYDGRVFRGGCWEDQAEECRVAFRIRVSRSFLASTASRNRSGFRTVRSIP